ncbi:hypothetical protein J1902_18440 [Arthrobacter sp. PO-11]|uniref:Uncharacterized protein n=1 Tax=Arthrobacter cavernae TaxID=2817681 RepID=A0A939KLG1_9MICC|nr:hypothetical protein [Arthrobacter cavernae]
MGGELVASQFSSRRGGLQLQAGRYGRVPGQACASASVIASAFVVLGLMPVRVGIWSGCAFGIGHPLELLVAVDVPAVSFRGSGNPRATYPGARLLSDAASTGVSSSW